MKKKSKIILLSIVAILIILFLFNKNLALSMLSILRSKFSKPDLEYVRNNQWQYDKGFKIGAGDFIEFGLDTLVFTLKKDTIFYKGKARAIVTSTNKHFFEMTVKSIDNKEKGFYANTEEFTQ
jgi:hypothetical protein